MNSEKIKMSEHDLVEWEKFQIDYLLEICHIFERFYLRVNFVGKFKICFRLASQSVLLFYTLKCLLVYSIYSISVLHFS